MPRTENDGLSQKVQSLAHTIGKNISLVSDEDKSLACFFNFRALSTRVHSRYKTLVKEVSKQKHITHEIEAIFDNFFVVEAAIFEIKNNLRKEDFKKLPLIKTGNGNYVPRLYHILSKLLVNTNRIVDKEIIESFLVAYQEHSPLSIRELYAIPSILQILFVEHFGLLIEKAILSVREYEEAGLIANKIKAEINNKNPHHFSKTISWLASKYPLIPLSMGFYLFQFLSQEASSVRPVIRWIKLNLEKQGIDGRNLIDIENRHRSENSTLSSNIIESLHWLTQARWENVVRNINIVDSILSKDPSGAYPMMDLDSKNTYRGSIIKMAENAGIHEAEIARTAVKLAQQNSKSSVAESHVGFYLIDKGRDELNKRINYKRTIKDFLYRLVIKNASFLYLGMAVVISIVLTGLFVLSISNAGVSGSALYLIGLIALGLSSDISLSAIGVFVSRFLPLRKLPGLDLSKGISETQKTFVVVPTMLRSTESIKETVRKLEIRYLGNNHDNIFYALLFDFKDAKKESLEGDDLLVETALKEIERLNNQYSEKSKKFFMLYRRRLWNEKEGVYMGWERKRGKLREFNMLLRGSKGTSYVNEDVLASMNDIKYVITLDEDTELPKDSALKLIGSIDHPLNKPVFSEKNNHLVRGYGIIQPRVSIRLAVASASIYSRLYSVTSGIDSYSTAVSDLYQDLFGNAIFFGKGIYDVDAVENTMKGQIPDNLVLSHDLLEGIYARTGYASNIVLFDGFPKFYHEFSIRLHRWIRGDWQIMGWLVKAHKPANVLTPIRKFSIIDRFKIFDNLRRSLIPVLSVIFIATAVFVPKASFYISLFLLSAIGLPPIIGFVNDLFSIKHIPFRVRVRDTFRQLISSFTHIVFRLTFLLHHAYISISAITLTLWRLFVTKKLLLEWQASTDVGAKLVGKLREFYRTMIITQSVPAIYFSYALYIGVPVKEVFVFCLIWLSSPVVAFLISRVKSEDIKIKEIDQRFLRSVAYKTSRYFLDFSRKENNWLVQDHYQEYPKTAETDRLTTSPTNIGMLFGSLFSSHELGFLPLDKFIDRTRKAFVSLSKLERKHGHLYNWYDIEKLEVLSPAYLSSVDSANFVMALIAFKQGVRELPKKPIISERSIKGIEDGLYCVIEEADRVLKGKFETRGTRNLVVEIRNLSQIAYDYVRNIKSPKLISETNTIFSAVHSHVVSIEKAVSLVRADESARHAEQMFVFVENLARLVEEEMAFQKYVLPHAHNQNISIVSHVSKNPEIFKLYKDIVEISDSIPTLHSAAYEVHDNIRRVNFEKSIETSDLSSDSKEYISSWYKSLLRSIEISQSRASEFLGDIGWIVRDCERFIDEPDFSLFYNKERELFHIGYNVTYDRLDKECYNFLASESNSISFVAILKNQAPQKHWFYLSRKLVNSGNKISLVSWGGSLFEYLTSLIYFKSHKESLLGQTARSAIAIHKKHGLMNRIPWGMGESAYYLFDSGKRYQYQVFGSPEIGLKRGLADYLVIAPYVSALALSFVPKSAIANLRKLIKVGGFGSFGYFDALDYMNENRVKTKRPIPTKIYYAHHLGFTMMSIHNFIYKDRIRELFHSDPRVASLEILLEEKMPTTPTTTTLSMPTRLPLNAVQGVSDNGSESKQYIPTKTLYPHLALLGNGSYSVAISNSGGGVSKYKGITLTRFREDSLLEETGSFIYIKNEKNKTIWSPTNRPVGVDSKRQKVIFHENKAEFHNSNGVFSSRLDVTVAKDSPVEIRSLSITNTGNNLEGITVASYGEVVLAPQSQDVHHPQYQKLMVKSVFLEEYNAIVYSRPHPSDRTKKIFFAHMISRNGFWRESAYPCVDRSVFIGKHRSFRDPIFFESDLPLKNNNSVPEYTLDPIFSLSRSVKIKPNETVKLTFVNIVNEDYEELLKLIRKFYKPRANNVVLNNALSDSADMTKSLGITQEMAVLFQKLASKALGSRQFDVNNLPDSQLPYINSLWKLGISGDYPVVVVMIKNIEDIQTVKQVLLCNAYWKSKGLQIDLVVFNKEAASYMKVLDDEIDFLLRQSKGGKTEPTGSSVYHVKSDLIEEIDKKVLLHVARVVLDSKDGTFKQQVQNALKITAKSVYPEKHVPKLKNVYQQSKQDISLPAGLEFQNQWGGFDSKNSEYVMALNSYSTPPVPWVNIIASPEFGTVVTESGSMFTWSRDSYENRLTAWHSDSIVFKSSEIFYLRDEDTGEVWNPTPLPIKSKYQYIVSHGKGYSRFEHKRNYINTVLDVSVSQENPVKVVTMTIENTGSKKKNLSYTTFIEPIMNVSFDHSRDFINFEYDQSMGAFYFRHMYKKQSLGAVGFVGMYPNPNSFTTDRVEFLGRHGSYEHPMALKRINLSNKITLGTENCIAMQSNIILNPGEKKTLTFVIGETKDKVGAEDIINIYRDQKNTEKSKTKNISTWKELRDSIQIDTPDSSLNALFNHQLLYQALSARIWAKTGFYQPSGAFGFRDQLQDITAFTWSRPQDVRDFILKAAAHQFKEGDALNWWHDHNNFGVRTVLSDHQLWLVYAVLEYVSVTGDESILNEQISFMESVPLNFAYQREWAGVPKISDEKASLYEHCVRALSKSSVFGTHGLPLMGMGDWNDGLSNTGIRGKGESVWLAWFMGYLMTRFAELSKKIGKTEEAERYMAHVSALSHSIEQNAWDGRWYRRAFMDSGIVLGSKKLKEFKIDSIAQSWAEISSIGREDRRAKALESMFDELYDGDAMRLLAPALKDSVFDPGYLKDYPPGVRENGSQYNHAALWAAQAMFKAGMPDKAKKIIDSVNPLKRSDSVAKANEYRVEPYVVASDIYASPSYKGRGGWTWYTGSAGVMYKTILQYIVGFRLEGNVLSFQPSLPTDWTNCSVKYKKGKTLYDITYEKPSGVVGVVAEVFENGKILEDKKVTCVDDGKAHKIKVVLQAR